MCEGFLATIAPDCVCIWSVTERAVSIRFVVSTSNGIYSRNGRCREEWVDIQTVLDAQRRVVSSCWCSMDPLCLFLSLSGGDVEGFKLHTKDQMIRCWHESLSSEFVSMKATTSFLFCQGRRGTIVCFEVPCFQLLIVRQCN